jgi:hypothetical protein
MRLANCCCTVLDFQVPFFDGRGKAKGRANNKPFTVFFWLPVGLLVETKGSVAGGKKVVMERLSLTKQCALL